MITDLISQLRRDEGEILHAYQDSQGYWTIGVGRLIDARVSGGISPEESAYLLQHDIDIVVAELQQHLPWTTKLDPVRLAVLQAMSFNMGFEHLVAFHRTLTLIEDGNYDAAAAAMLQSKWATEVGQRAQRLSLQLKTGVWQ